MLLLPPEANAVHIMVATGTGIAPYRAYLRRMFMEDIPDYKFTGLAWLFMGVANSDAKLYDDEFQAIAKKYPKQVRFKHFLCTTRHLCCTDVADVEQIDTLFCTWTKGEKKESPDALHSRCGHCLMLRQQGMRIASLIMPNSECASCFSVGAQMV